MRFHSHQVLVHVIRDLGLRRYTENRTDNRSVLSRSAATRHSVSSTASRRFPSAIRPQTVPEDKELPNMPDLGPVHPEDSVSYAPPPEPEGDNRTQVSLRSSASRKTKSTRREGVSRGGTPRTLPSISSKISKSSQKLPEDHDVLNISLPSAASRNTAPAHTPPDTQPRDPSSVVRTKSYVSNPIPLRASLDEVGDTPIANESQFSKHSKHSNATKPHNAESSRISGAGHNMATDVMSGISCPRSLYSGPVPPMK